ncbi:zonular occludens toxin domain-containing protein [Acinetobacter baumannii]|uniref:zonular occludens toxin domain-containing protein n=1 Tax=Acinetobacter baumannii TaxID=470 RepID=UPI000BF439AF|nr:zonular occludens toxin domain-containing protein [Acinetobacter baumannii]MDC5380747.1 zonular occludens toxin domain-containing protein [Acinetobacter baumannii]MDC5493269.1 zonular occludens toxin domain-containing protein [Acinetobacter baumannii]MDC5494267.1 zonular occludens toxin domain-containing protein [Acinetobacter baumannii]MDC5668327.1 zonular occludens toxin domain-containing protein [Acinetobacter baumannii]MDC5676061.1 zonular occludens toxin domain-containing protein [Acin
MARIRLTTGGIGAGKTYLNVKLADEAHKKGQYTKIYSNIRAHSELTDYVYDLPDDWRECENGSLVIIDELQFNEKFSKHFSQRRDKEVVDITMIRHDGIDMWLITQSTKFMNSDIRELVNEHFYIEVTGKKTSKCYCFAQAQTSISKAVKKQAHDEFSYTLEQKYFDMYKSTKDGVKPTRTHHINMKLIGFVVGALFTLALIFGLLTYLGKSNKKNIDEMTKTNDVTQPANTKSIADQLKEQSALAGLTPEQYADLMNPEKRNAELQAKNDVRLETIAIKYNPNRPYDVDTSNIQYQATSKPVFSGCIKKGKKYVAYTQQGTILRDVDPSDCKRLIEDGDRPFNYFQQPVIQQQVVQQAPQTVPTTQQVDAEFIAKYQLAKAQGLI